MKIFFVSSLKSPNTANFDTLTLSNVFLMSNCYKINFKIKSCRWNKISLNLSAIKYSKKKYLLIKYCIKKWFSWYTITLCRGLTWSILSHQTFFFYFTYFQLFSPFQGLSSCGAPLDLSETNINKLELRKKRMMW